MNIKSIIHGNKNFVKHKFKKYEKKYADLVKEGQKPNVLFIGCCDSRVVPNLITDSEPGELFVVQNIGNFVPPYTEKITQNSTAAAVEYGVFVLNVSDIVVCGHSHCGAIAGLYSGNKIDTPELIHVKEWLKVGNEAKNYVDLNGDGQLSMEARLEMTEKMSIIFQLENLLTYPTIKEKVDSGELNLRGWYYKIETGEIFYYNEEEEDFLPMND